jgi:uncharacterized protein involved in cysteine biosynthesis
MILAALRASLRQMPDPRLRRIMGLGVALAAGCLLSVSLLMLWGLSRAMPADVGLPLIGPVDWLGGAMIWAVAFVFSAASAVLMLPLAGLIMTLLLDRVADAVEDRHYPALPPAQPASLGDTLKDAVNFWGVLIAVNILALVLYLLFAPVALLVFWAVNGYLLGREYFMQAALRRLPRAEARALRAQHAGKVWVMGVLIAMPLGIPLINLLVPILGAASFTHLFHMSQGRVPSG